MSITLRVIQRFDIRHQKEFLELEKLFAQLERARPDFVNGKRRRPIAAAEPVNTLIWEGEFPDLAAAQRWLEFLETDGEHSGLFARQQPYFEAVRIEFYENLEY
ncbi:MAG: hypothetical protein V1794_06790 [Candidatus Glassbacteria bacterium]